MLTQLNDVFKEFKPCDFKKDFSFLENLQENISEKLVHDNDISPREFRQETNKTMDEIDAKRKEASPTLDDPSGFNRATKSIQVAGQILRNYVGSMKKEKKVELAEACFSLGKRSIKAILELIELYKDEFIVCFEEQIHSENPKTKSEKIKKRAEGIVYFLAQVSAISFIKRVSQSVGSPNLKITFEDVLEVKNDLGNQFFDLSINFDHYSHFPLEKIQKLNKNIDSNYFTSLMLKILTLGHFLYFDVDYRSRQQACGILDIPFKTKPKLKN